MLHPDSSVLGVRLASEKRGVSLSERVGVFKGTTMQRKDFSVSDLVTRNVLCPSLPPWS